MAQINAQRLTKRFRRAVKAPGLGGSLRHVFRPQYTEKIAVDAITFSIEAGEAAGYVGPNGAGKSTTIKLLTGILVPSDGAVQIEGLAPHRHRIAIAKRIGVVFGQRTQLWWDLPVQESFRLLGDLYQVPTDVYRRSMHTYTDLLELTPLMQVPARQLSLGQRMRCDLAAALLHEPPILFLDEPTIGLDVAVKARIRAFIKQIRQERGVTVLLTSHDLGDIADLCDRLIMLDRGKIVYDGPLGDITRRFGGERVIRLLLAEAIPDALALATHTLPEIPSQAIRQTDVHHLEVAFDPAQITAGMIAGRLLPLLPVADLQIDEPSIEAIIKHLYDGTLSLAEPEVPHAQ